MRQAKGRTSQLRATRKPSPDRAETLLLAHLADPQGQARLALAAAGVVAERRLGLMLHSSMPARWAVDLALADASWKLDDKPTEVLLDDYLQARLAADLPKLVAGRLLSAAEAREMLEHPELDRRRAWAAVRAVTLLAESDRLCELAATAKPECGRSAILLSQRCERIAREDLANPPSGICAMAAFALSLAHGLTRNREQSRLYDGATITRHRRLLAAASGREVAAPVLSVDFSDVGAVQGVPNYDLLHYGWAPPTEIFSLDGSVEAWVNHTRINQELAANDGYSSTLLHELLHTLQGETVWPANAAEGILNTILEEGATEAKARMLLLRHVRDFDAAIYTPHIIFVMSLTKVAAAPGGRTRAHKLVTELAFSSHLQRPLLAAQMLTGGGGPEHLAALTAAAGVYFAFAIDTDARRDFNEMRNLAEKLLCAVRDDAGVPS